MTQSNPEVFSDKAAEAYAHTFARLSGGYITSIQAIVESGFATHIERIQASGGHAMILEVGGGGGRSAWAIETALQMKNLTEFSVVGTEPNRHQINGGRSSFADGDTQLHIPEIQASAEALPFIHNGFDAVVGSQVLHWVTGDHVKDSFSEAHRVLKPGGILVHATSGIVDLGNKLNNHHFTRHPFVRRYLRNLEEQLTASGHWNTGKLGEFVPWNPNAHRYYYRLTLPGIEKRILEAGFRDVETTTYMFPCSSDEMKMRLTNLSAINMHFFSGPFADTIPDDLRVALATKAFNDAKKAEPDLWTSFDSQPLGIHIGPKPGTFGEPVPVIIAHR